MREEHENRGVETSDVGTPGIVKFAIGLAIGILVSMVLIWGLIQAWRRYEAGSAQQFGLIDNRAEKRTPPAPQLLSGTGLRVRAEDLTADPAIQKTLTEGDLNYELERPEEYREVLDRVKESELSSYGSMRIGSATEYRIPIAEAKRRLIGQIGTIAMPQAGAGEEKDDRMPTAASAGRVAERRLQ